MTGKARKIVQEVSGTSVAAAAPTAAALLIATSDPLVAAALAGGTAGAAITLLRSLQLVPGSLEHPTELRLRFWGLMGQFRQAQRDFHLRSHFGRTALRDSFDQIEARARAVSRKRLTFDRDTIVESINQKYDWTQLPSDEVISAARDAGEFHVSCPLADCAAFATFLHMKDTYCPEIQVTRGKLVTKERLLQAAGTQVELAVAAVAPYVLSSESSIRRFYHCILPLYRAEQFVLYRPERSKPVRLARIFALEESSSVEQYFVQHRSDKKLDEIDIGSLEYVLSRLDTSSGLAMWNPLAGEMKKDHGLEYLERVPYETWLCLFASDEVRRGRPDSLKAVVELFMHCWASLAANPGLLGGVMCRHRGEFLRREY